MTRLDDPRRPAGAAESRRSRTRLVLAAYLALVIASRITIAWGPSEPPLPSGMQRVAISANTGVEGRVAPADGARAPRSLESTTLAYRTLGPHSGAPVLLLHGSPGSLQDFDALAARIAPDRFIVVPDLLGFGASSRDVPDHSFVAQADALIALLDALSLERVHVVGFSWGGGVAIELASRAPERVASLGLVSALGVEELELLGRGELNHLIHRLQQVLLAALDWGIPHFGRLDGGFGLRGFARSFVDSDQGPLRGELELYSGPALIVHGRQDFLVPPAAAREHHRLLPQSDLVWIDGGHLVLWRAPEQVAGALVDFFDAVEAGRAPTRTAARPERLAAARRPFDPMLAGPQDGLGWVVFFLLVFAASLAGEDLTCIGVGVLVAIGQVPWPNALAACVVALVAGDLLLYAGGRVIGPPLLQRFGRDPAEVGAIAARFSRSGGKLVLLGRFVPGARLPTYVAAGALAVPIVGFTGWLALAALLWVPVIGGATIFVGRALGDRITTGGGNLALALGCIFALAIAARLAPRLATWRGRRLLLARWKRIARWEFWPIWAIYLPMVPAIAALALRHRSLRIPTLVNPPIPGGGLAGESKAAIGALLAGASEHAIATLVVESGAAAERCQAVDAFRRDHGLDYPIVLKPDIGERGRDVAIASGADAVRRYFDDHAGRTLAQAFVPGEEFGLFYTRLPDAPTGELFSIARKTPRYVTGDGVHSLERLILTDAICLPVAEKLLVGNAERRSWVPTKGERVRVTQLGTHSLGCRFLVGEDLRTPALEAAVDRLSQKAGLDFGRFDVRAESETALREGRFRVLEFNGLTGEAAHLYDPRYSLFEGLAILRAQWRRAFAIGAAHRARGRRPLSFAALAALVRQARRGS